MLRLSLIAALVVALAYGKHEIYDGYKLYKVTPANDAQYEALSQLRTRLLKADFWSMPHPSGRHGTISVPPEEQELFLSLMKNANIAQEVVVDNLRVLFEDEEESLNEARDKSLNRIEKGNFSFDFYPRYYEIENYLDELAAEYPNKVQVVVGGKSFEGRDVKYLKISSSGFKDNNKPIIFIDAGIHAREWIAPITAVYAIDKLVKNVTEGDLLERADWIILPVVNPDGYEFTFTNERLWRKTRSILPGTSCVGVDGNRNFDFKWMVSGGSSSSQPCSDTYAGPAPFSESETAIVGEILSSLSSRIKLMLTFHSHGSYLVYPWSYDGSDATNAEDLHRVGVLAGRAIDEAAPSGSVPYLVGNSGQLLYTTPGCTDDYAMSVGIPFAYTIELPSRNYEFELPPSFIGPVLKETWEGIVVFAREVLKSNLNRV